MRLKTMWALAALGTMTATGCAQDDLLETRTMAMSATPVQLMASECDDVPIEIDPALVYDDLDRLQSHFQLRDVLDQLLSAADVVAPASADAVWSQWWRSNLAHDPAAPVDEPRCGDGEGADRNGFPLVCDRAEALLAEPEHPIETHQPVQLVNRFDLMPLDGSHCGEYRIVYAMKDSDLDGDGVNEIDAPFGENLIIFEGVLPNPDPGCGAAGCRPVVDFWARLSTLDEDDRIDELQRFYFEGLTELGTEPVVRPEAYGMNGGDDGYSAGHGQIRTNQFVHMQSWTLREYHLDRECTTVTLKPKPALTVAKHKTKTKRRLTKKSFSLAAVAAKPQTKTTCTLVVRPAPVAGNPFPGLFTGDDEDALLFQAGPDTEASFLSQLDAMIPTEPLPSGAWPTETVNHITMATDPRWNAAESIESGGNSQNPLNTYDIIPKSPFGAAVTAALPADGPYDAAHIANRATAAGCAGCHTLSGASDRLDLGNSVTWDFNTFFTHVDRFGGRSDIMDTSFLPHRKSVMARYLAKTCEECLDKPLLRDIDGDFITDEDLNLEGATPEKGTAALPAPSPTLAKDVVQLGGKATLGGSLTH